LQLFPKMKLFNFSDPLWFTYYSSSYYFSIRVIENGMVKVPRKFRTKHRSGSKADRLEKALIPLMATCSGGPSSYAIALAPQLGFTPSKQDVQRILTRLNMTRKTRSLVPGLSVPIERWAHLAQLRSFWFHPSQMIFVDEKKLKIGDIQQRCDEYVYSSINARPGLRVRGLSTVFTHAVTPRQEIAGALAYMPNRSLPLQDGRLGDVGLIDFVIQEPKLGIATTLHWITHDLVKHLTPYPGPCSLVILDNMPEHQKHKKVIEKAINDRGAFVVWNPPRSPDLNPIEKLWDVVVAMASRRMVELLSGQHGGVARGLAQGDVVVCCKNARLSLHAFRTMILSGY